MEEVCPDAGKSSWPELVGMKGEEAKEIIDRENPKVTAEILPEGTIILAVIICTRVIVWVNDCGFVTKVPGIG